MNAQLVENSSQSAVGSRPVLVVPMSIRRQMSLAVESVYPEEAVGILYGRISAAGDRRLVERVEHAFNEAPARIRHNHYEISPDRMLLAQKTAEERGEEILGFFHSHPDAAPRPSDLDLARAWPGYSYLIVGVTGGQAEEIKAYMLDEKRFEMLQQPLELDDA
ncbi:MAG: Mov34/MPN/PAD-1 family protein [Phycisphaerae bacterium]